MSLNFPTEVAKKTLRRSYDKLYRAEFLLTNLLAIILSLILLTSLSLISLKLIIHHFQVIGNFFPNEYRESATLLTTDLLLKGGNPYALENQPEYTNVYGIFYHIIVLPLPSYLEPAFLSIEPFLLFSFLHPVLPFSRQCVGGKSHLFLP
jgi:hypothetical protein